MLETDGEVEEARMLYRSVVSDHGGEPADPDLLEIVGWCRHRLGDDDGAERTFRMTLEIEPARASARFDLALTLLSLGRGEEALAEVDTALLHLRSADPGHRRAAVQVALDDLQRALLTDARVGAAPEAGRAQVALEAALARMPGP
jgi:Flp pilus assembly protein TadD